MAGVKRKAESEVDDKTAKRTRQVCPYLDTINRHVLDFDFEKVCSVTLEDKNIYACLVCGKYFQGRGPHTQANFHSLQADHHMFISLHTRKAYCLPDNYIVQDSSLRDIEHVMCPVFTKEEIARLDTATQYSKCLGTLLFCSYWS